MLLLSDVRLLDIPVIDNGEPMVDVTQASDLPVDSRKADPQGAWHRVRRAVLERLLVARTHLPAGVDLLLVEGYRPASLQAHYFDRHVSGLLTADPALSTLQARVQASQHVSPVEVAPHPCGAAVDVTLSLNGDEVDMGTAVNATPEESDRACFTDATNIPSEAVQWRKVLASAMTAAGFVNYEPEWWHWSYGDLIWAATTGAPAALYGPR